MLTRTLFNLLYALTVCIALFGVVPAQADITATEVAELLASDGGVSEYFGWSTAVSGNTAVIGATNAKSGGISTGAAYVFVHSGGIWTEQAKLTASDGQAFDQFGTSVDVDGDTIVVGAVGDDDNGLVSGSAYVFVRSGGVWTEQVKLTASDGEEQDRFGHSVAVVDDTVMVGAYLDDDNGIQSGSVYVFARTLGTWSEQTKLLASDGTRTDFFGRAIAIDGDTAIVGAHFHDQLGVTSGAAYIFVRISGAWLQQTKLLASDREAFDSFGWSVAIDGDTAVVGAYTDDDNGSSSGSAYVFARSSGSWVEQSKLLASDGAAGDDFGWSVAVSGNIVLVGARRNDDAVSNSGSAYVFTENGILWTEQAKLTASDETGGDNFGHSVSLADQQLALIGANFHDDSAFNAGAVYVFEVTGGDTDNDGISDEDDNCPDNANPNQEDNDEDGNGDACDTDDDNDGIDDVVDNCSLIANPDQVDFDTDGFGDICDSDDDNDGLDDQADLCPNTLLPEQTVPLLNLGINRWALIDDDMSFNTRTHNDLSPKMLYNLTDTRGCSCEQIITELELGVGHAKYGCSTGAMEEWISANGL